MAAATPLRVLCGENWLTPARLTEFSERVNVPVQVFTYARPNELLQQLANTDGRIDVICASSFLTRSLARNHWLKKAKFLELENAKTLSVDMVHLPFDPTAEYGVPLFWNLYGFFGTGTKLEGSLKSALHAQKIAIWGDQLNILDLLALFGVNTAARLEQEQNKEFDDGLHSLLKSAARVLPPVATEKTEIDLASNRWDWAQLPLARVADQMSESRHFVMSEDGGALEVGLLSVGDKAQNPELALRLINELIAPEHGLEAFRRVRAGVVHQTYDNAESLPAGVRPRALRDFPLTKLRFPDLDVENVPRLAKVYDEILINKK